MSQQKRTPASPSSSLKLRSLIKRHTTFAAAPSDLYKLSTKKSRDSELNNIEEDFSSSSKIISLENVGLCGQKFESPRNTLPSNDYLLRPISLNIEKPQWGSPSRLNSSKNMKKREENLNNLPSSNDFVNETRLVRRSMQFLNLERTASFEEESNSKGKRNSNRLKKGLSINYGPSQIRTALKKSTLAITLENLRKTEENA